MAEARIEVRGDLTDITEKFAQLRGQIQALDGQAAAPVSALTERFKSIGTVLAGVGAAMSAVGSSFAAFGIAAAKGAGQTAEQLDNLRQKTGLTTDELRQLTPIFNRFNTDLNALVGPFKVLSKNFEEAAAGSEKAQAKFKALGIEISASDRPIDVLGKVADAAARLGPGFERNAEMAKLMGRGVSALVPILAEGSQGMAKSAQDARDMGLMLGAVTENQLKDMDDAFDDLGTVSKAFRDTIGTAFAPVLLRLTQALTSTIGVFNNWFQGLDAGTKNLVVIFTGVFALGGPILIAVGAFMAALTVITAPMLVGGAIVAGVVAALTLLVVYWDNLREAGIARWTALREGVTTAVTRMVDLIQDQTIGRLQRIWDTVGQKVEVVKGYFHGLYDAVVGHSYIPDMVQEIGDHMSQLDVRMGAPARIATTNTLRTFRDFSFSASQVFGEIASVAVATWGQVTNSIAGSLAKNITQGNNWAQTWKSIQNLVLQGFLNLGLQMLTQWAIVLGKKVLFDEAEATAHAGMEGAKTAATTAGETTRLALMAATNKAMMAGVIATLGGLAAVGAAALSAMELAVITVSAIMDLIGLALIAGIFTAPIGVAMIGASQSLLIGGTSAVAGGLGALEGAIGGAIVASTAALATPFATGGLVLGPILGLVGEAGPELIVPLDKVGEMGGGQTQTITVQIGDDVVMRAVARGLPRYLELRGVRAV